VHRLAALLVLAAPSAAHAQHIPGALPPGLSLSIERPDVVGHLQLTFQRTDDGGRIVGCQTDAADASCAVTRTVTLSEAQVDALERRWRALSAGARCRIQRPDGNWTPFTLRWSGGEIEARVYERGDEGLSARCFAIERVGGWFLRAWRDAPH
jgi:hypothetical protein